MKPSIVIVGLDQVFLDEVIQGFTGETKTIDSNPIEWTIDTKYYTADVHLCPLNTKMLVEESVANSAQMLIVLLDPAQINSRTKLDSWLPFLSVLSDCDAKLLVARNVAALSNTISKTDIKQWCTEHDYELLELEKSTTSETEDDDDEDEENTHLYRDVYGVPRLVQALHVHQWPNMDLKDRREINRSLAKQLKEKLNFDSNDETDHSQAPQEQNEQVDSSSLTNNHHETDAFGMENIFEQMRRYKEEADQLTGDERKQFAEKVILSLWKDFGDDDAVVDDESDDADHA